MATVIVSSVWTRIYEFYDNVENRYRNTWDTNDTLEQINKIMWVIQNFESICKWSRRKIRIIKFVLSMISMVFELVLISSAMIVSVMANN